jgi:membrane protease YdiL (CAAX protease family)
LSLFDLPYDPDRGSSAWSPRFPLGGVSRLAGMLGAVIAGVHLAGMPPEIVAVVGVAVGHGTLLMVAFASADTGWRRPTLVVVGLLAAAAALSRAGLAGPLAYLLVPAVIWCLARRRPAWEALGITTAVPLRAALVGLASGLCLGAHLLITASRTLGYQVGGLSVGAYAVAIGYDLGANVVSAECLFRGALFNGLQRRWPFWAAAVVSTLAEVVRYVVDPSLPKSADAIAGAVFYVVLLGIASCALFRWSGSLVPGAIGRLSFFAVYRSLRGW